MRLFLLILLTMCAFAANSILNRLAVDGGHADPASFAVIRVLSGAVALVVLARLRGRLLTWGLRQRAVGAGTLALYMVGFSVAYLTLDAGLGALILFGVVQMTMFTVSAMSGTRPPPRQLSGAAVAFVGLVLVLWPGAEGGVTLRGAAFMIAAGIGWGLYSLAGRSEPDALTGTAANFCLALPLTLLAPLIAGVPMLIQPTGLALAVLSGAVTSGMGYALWYSLLPRLSASFAATLQLSVPVIAVAAGVAFLGETVGLRFVVGAALVLGGIALSLRKTPGN
ncbi:DMT family transporter [Arenibacterium sp. CAU 1754]